MTQDVHGAANDKSDNSSGWQTEGDADTKEYKYYLVVVVFILTNVAFAHTMAWYKTLAFTTRHASISQNHKRGTLHNFPIHFWYQSIEL